MVLKTVLGVIIFILGQISFLTSSVASAILSGKGYYLPDLLMPQRDMQINLRIPDYYYARVPRFPAALTLSIDLLVSNDIPFRLFLNLTNPKPTVMLFKPSRHLQNQVVWLVYVVVSNNPNPLNLLEAVQGSSLGTEIGWSYLIHKDWTQIIVDRSEADNSLQTWWNANIYRIFLPLRIIVLYWSSSGFKNEVMLVRESCHCDDLPSSVALTQFFDNLFTNGISGIAEQIMSIKADFRGKRIVIKPNRRIYGSWEAWRHILMFFSLRQAHASRRSAFAGIFDTFLPLHNFTFDLVPAE